jgi:hypothetical protein
LIDFADAFSKVTRHGMGKDIWNVPFEDITLMLKVRLIICHAAQSGVDQRERVCKLTCRCQHSTFMSSSTSTKW